MKCQPSLVWLCFVVGSLLDWCVVVQAAPRSPRRRPYSHGPSSADENNDTKDTENKDTSASAENSLDEASESSSTDSSAPPSTSEWNVTDLLRQTAEVLKTHEARVEQVEALSGRHIDLRQRSRDMQQSYSQLTTLTREVDDLLRSKVNVLLVRHLQERLTQVWDQELRVQALLETFSEEAVESAEITVPTAGITKDQLEELLAVDQIFAFHNQRVEALISEILKETFAELPFPDLSLVESAVEDEKSPPEMVVEVTTATTSEACIDVATTAQLIQSALVEYQHQEGLTPHSTPNDDPWYDHAQQVGWIVHQETADTYVPPRLASSSSNAPLATWADEWWTAYVPEDWEEWALPEDWMERPLPSWMQQRSSSSTTATAAALNPPEAILDGITLPGACWAVPVPVATMLSSSAGTSKNPPTATRVNSVDEDYLGYIPYNDDEEESTSISLQEVSSAHVTIALPHSIRLSAVTIDHASRRLLSTEEAQSAPRRIRLVAYPPCSGVCIGGRTYDHTDPMEIGVVQYDLEGSVTQRFELAEILDGIKSEDNTCSDDGVPSCAADFSAPFSIDDNRVSALRAEILDNHGNDEYSCLYRLRIHGEMLGEKSE